jgi:hypothetical protein
MSASMTTPQQMDGLEKLLTLANLTPEKIIATQKAMREQMQLTAEEQAKVAEAREYISKHALLSATMEKREADLAAASTAHEQAKAEFANHVKSENKRLEEFSAKIDARDRRTADDVKQLETAKNTFAGLQLDHDRQHRDLLLSYQKQEAKNATMAAENAAEAERLKEWAATLKRKAELARQKLAEF